MVYRNKPFQKLITGPAALPLASLPPPPFYFRAFSIPSDPTILELEQVKENYTDLADIPFPFYFGAFLPLPHFCLPLFAPAKKTKFLWLF